MSASERKTAGDAITLEFDAIKLPRDSFTVPIRFYSFLYGFRNTTALFFAAPIELTYSRGVLRSKYT